MVKPGNCPWQLQLSSYYYCWQIGSFYDENYYLADNLANKFSIPISRDWNADNPGIRDWEKRPDPGIRDPGIAIPRYEMMCGFSATADFLVLFAPLVNLTDSNRKDNHMTKIIPGHHWGSLQRSPRPSSWWAGAWLPPLQEPHPLPRPFGPHSSVPPILNRDRRHWLLRKTQIDR